MKRLLILGITMMVLSFVVTTVGIAQALSAAATQETAGAQEELASGLSKLGAGIAIGIAAGMAGIGLGAASAAAIGVIAERPEMFGRTMIYIVFIEAMAIYGLVIALLLWMG